MKKTSLLLLIIASGICGYAQYTVKLSDAEVETETKRIREYYKLVNKEKPSFKQTETRWSYDEELREKYGDSEYEYNEEGNDIITELTYTSENQVKLILIDREIVKYQVPYSKKIHEEFYFNNEELVFYFFEMGESLSAPDYFGYTDMSEGERVIQIRIYLKNGKIFKFLTKEVFSAKEDASSTEQMLLDTPNKIKDIDTITMEDYDCIIQYLH
jgi:hypothetical protein